MRVLAAFAFALTLPAPLLAQQTDDAHNNLFVDHSSTGSNGAHRIGARIDSSPARPTMVQSALPTPLAQPANSGILLYQPRSLNDVAKEYAKAHHKAAGTPPL